MKEKTFLHQVAVEALVQDMPDFMALLLDHGLSLREFITEDHLETLYRKVFINFIFLFCNGQVLNG